MAHGTVRYGFAAEQQFQSPTASGSGGGGVTVRERQRGARAAAVASCHRARSNSLNWTSIENDRVIRRIEAQRGFPSIQPFTLAMALALNA